MMGITVQPESMAVLCIGLCHWVQLNDGHHGTATVCGGTVYRFMAVGAAG